MRVRVDLLVSSADRVVPGRKRGRLYKDESEAKKCFNIRFVFL